MLLTMQTLISRCIDDINTLMGVPVAKKKTREILHGLSVRCYFNP
jgi:hypothetical protein